MMTTRKASIAGLLLLSGLLGGGCASTPAPKEILDARAAYNHAAAAAGAPLTPVPLHEARLALDEAERAYRDDAESQRTRDLAYIAVRKAELAESRGNTALSMQSKEQSRADLERLGAWELATAKGELNRTRDQLEKTADQLAAEKVARERAEKRARETMDKLAVAAALAIKEEPRGTVIVLPGGVFFVSGKADILPVAQQKLNAVADALKEEEDRTIVVEGHTDSQGTEQSNLELGQRRAQAVRDYLVSRGVKPEAISAIGIGQGRPIADNKSPEGRANNRRVEIIIQKIEKR